MRKSRPSIDILLAVSQTIIREALRYLLEQQPDMQIVAETGDGREVVRLVINTRPEVAIIDLRMPGISGLEILSRLPATVKKVRVLVLATAEDKDRIVQAFRLGVRGVALRESTMNVLPAGIRSVAEGKYWIAGDTFSSPGKGLRRFGARSQAGARKEAFGLTRRELEIISAITSGHSNTEISERLSISQNTVKHHVTNIFDKVGVYNRLELALFAIHHNLIGRA
jgi:two-component system, NarL family, nitrate/nitrite response regulator NarL